MEAGNGFLAGVIEGFYGREWSWETRGMCVDFLASSGLNSYLYCPKGDAYLRKRWRENWPAEQLARLHVLAESCRQRSVWWGVGLSPYALYQDYSRPQQRALQERISQINDLGGALLALLFDDMPGDCTDLAQRQAEIAADVLHWSSAERLLICPTYYSLDPVLEVFFGAMPANYWPDLGAALPGEVDIFWTGTRVCSASVGVTEIEAIGASLGRAPVLWDNYPVNDGATASNFLHLKPLQGRESGLRQVLRGHFCNPMNQGALSRLPLSGLVALYGNASAAPDDCFTAELRVRLRQDQSAFEDLGLAAMSCQEREEKARAYEEIDDPAAAEVAGWLRGEYAFDPACLTG